MDRYSELKMKYDNIILENKQLNDRLKDVDNKNDDLSTKKRHLEEEGKQEIN